ncbi:MAG: DUF177 domain-containing protein [Bacteroidaceae bacterium]|nr:DUF177 domain-containing protein [Bacteroidaceae bacterium]
MLEKYDIDLKIMEVDEKVFAYSLDDNFFTALETQDVTRGLVEAQVHVKKLASSFELDMYINGHVIIQCDRCLDDMIQPVDANNKLFVKFGPAYLDEGDDLVIVPEDEGKVNVAWFLYEIVALSIPIQHTHAPGECNKEMMKILKEHSEQFVEDENSEPPGENVIDPRWNDLKKLLNNN